MTKLNPCPDCGRKRAAQDKKTLRDEFAMAALTGILAYPGCDYYGSAHNNGTPESVAREAYVYADPMLKEREK